MQQVRRKIHTDERGTTAVEFAIVGPIFIFLVIGIAFLCMGLAVAGSMHYAVEEGARCASVRKMVCSDEDTTIAYTKAHYFGPGGVPTFAYDAGAACGHSVTASISYVVDMGLKKVSVPITAAACFP
jgi:Flp pilus assembly pilin Flp